MGIPTISLPSPTTDKPPRPRRWIPLSLRMFAVMLLLVAACSSLWIGIRIFRRESAIRQIERASGKIEWRQAGPKWVRRWFGPDRNPVFDIVDGANLDKLRSPEVALGHLQHLNNLERLSAINPLLTDGGMEYFGDLHRLQVVYLIKTRVSDTGLRHLAGVTDLRELYLDGTEVTDAGLTHLARLQRLQILGLIGTNVTDAGIAKLKGGIPRLTVEQ